MTALQTQIMAEVSCAGGREDTVGYPHSTRAIDSMSNIPLPRCCVSS